MGEKGRVFVCAPIAEKLGENELLRVVSGVRAKTRSRLGTLGICWDGVQGK